MTLLKLLAAYRRFSPEPFTLTAITVDLNFKDNPADFSPLAAFCAELDVPFLLEKTDIGEVVFDVRKEENPCSLCAKMRKGALNAAALSAGCNKIALGHHADDFIETMFLSLLYEGRLSTCAPKVYLDRTKLTFIRPMVYLEEKDIAAYGEKPPGLQELLPREQKHQAGIRQAGDRPHQKGRTVRARPHVFRPLPPRALPSVRSVFAEKDEF